MSFFKRLFGIDDPVNMMDQYKSKGMADQTRKSRFVPSKPKSTSSNNGMVAKANPNVIGGNRNIALAASGDFCSYVGGGYAGGGYRTLNMVTGLYVPENIKQYE